MTSRIAPFRSRDLIATLLMGALVLVARASFADHYVVPSGSMEPTVTVGDQICVNKVAYGLRVPASQTYLIERPGPERGEVVVLVSPVDGQVLLKRVVAVPGDMVAVEDGRPLINGALVPLRQDDHGVVEQLGEHFHAIGTAFGGGPDLADTRVPDHEYFVMGDNRGNSFDGRYFGFVQKNAILGRASAVCLHGGIPAWKKL